MAITKPFSLQGTTIEIVSYDATAMTALSNAIKNATTEAQRVTAFTNYLTGSVGASGTITCAASTFTASNVDNYLTGTWTHTNGATGRFYSTVNTATVATVMLITTSGALPTGAITTGLTFAFDSNAGVLSLSQANTPTSYALTGVANPITAASIGKITAAGETGKTYKTISAELINENQTYKGKGTADEGEFTVDYLNVPADAGQMALQLALDDMATPERVIRVTHTSGEIWYGCGIVTDLKKARGANSAFSTVKAKIPLIFSAEYNPA